MTQRQRVLAALLKAGSHGVCGYEMGVLQPLDQGPRITRLAARIQELRADGVDIVKKEKRRHGHDVYVLRESLHPKPNSQAEDQVLPLFPTKSDPISPYDLDAA